MLVLFTLLRGMPMAVKYEHMVVLWSALCWWRWRKRLAAAETGSLCSRSFSSMVVDSPLKLFLCMSRKRVTV